jgi:hypothetical protein
MNSREMIQKNLQHQETKVPIDFGSTAVSGIHVSIVEKLRDHYGLAKSPVKVEEPYQMLGRVEDDLKEAIGIETDGVMARNTFFGFTAEDWKPFTLPWGQEVLVPGNFNTTQDINDDLLIYPEGDTSAPPSGRMPTSGFFFDSIIRQDPIEEEKLDPENNLEEFVPLSADDMEHYKAGTEQASRSGRAVVATIGGGGLGDIALIPAPFMKYPKGIRDITEWYISLVSRKDYIHAVYDRQTDIAVENFKALYQGVGDAIDVVFLCGTDFGTQTSSFCSAETFREIYMPYYKKMTGWIHSNTSWKVFKHSCGAVFDFVPLFIEAGFDILNPVQLSATGMDAAELKKQYGKEISFWGGGVDTQKTLPFGSPEEVRKEVLTRLEIFSRGGGFIFNTIHNVQAKTPLDNIVAMIDAVGEFNGS